jgi:two-component system, NtrC family, sensor histidine kinase HydH
MSPGGARAGIENTSKTLVAAVFGGILAISVLHDVTPLSDLHWHNIYQHVYYLPIVIAGLSFGWRGGLAAGLFAGLTNAPHNLMAWKMLPSYAIDQMLDIPVFCAAGVLTGVLAERGRRQRSDLERTTGRLAEVYKELQDNFERMKRAERLFALGHLSAGLAHEVRNPVASIAGAVGILQRNSSLSQRETECLAIIAKECQRLNQLLSHFLDFARPRAPHFQTGDIGQILDSVLELAGHAVGRRPIRLQSDVSPHMEPVECDPELLKQVLLNLVINATQAMPDGGVVLVTARMRQGRAVIEVKDEGCGIDPGDRDKIFDPFFTTKESGTGLGLSVAHQIVEQHGGILTAEANPVKGMTFAVSLPLRHERPHEP